MLYFFTIAISLWIIAHLYIGLRLIVPARLRTGWAVVAWAVLVAFMLHGPVVFIFSRAPDKPTWLTLAQSFSYVNMGFFALVLSFVILRDLGWLGTSTIDRVLAFLHDAARSNPDSAPRILPADPDRRRFLMQSFNVGILGLSGTLAGIGYYEARRRPDVVRVSLPLKDLPPDLEGFRIVQVTDTHIGPTIEREAIEAIVETANSLDPHVIAFTGDLVDGYVPEMRTRVAPIGDLRAPHGVFFVTGNHEYYWDLTGWLKEVRRLGLTVLLNEHRLVEHGSGRFLLAGVTDYSAGRHLRAHASSPAAAAKDAPPSHVKLLLAHQPRSVYAAAQAGFDVQLSGHTHGGQFFPWIFLVRLQQPYIAGLHRFEERTWVYVSRGAGYWGPPLRLGVPSEITLLTLTADGSPA